jgi:hypothetical protein
MVNDKNGFCTYLSNLFFNDFFLSVSFSKVILSSCFHCKSPKSQTFSLILKFIGFIGNVKLYLSLVEMEVIEEASMGVTAEVLEDTEKDTLAALEDTVEVLEDSTGVLEASEKDTVPALEDTAGVLEDIVMVIMEDLEAILEASPEHTEVSMDTVEDNTEDSKDNMEDLEDTVTYTTVDLEDTVTYTTVDLEDTVTYTTEDLEDNVEVLVESEAIMRWVLLEVSSEDLSDNKVGLRSLKCAIKC